MKFKKFIKKYFSKTSLVLLSVFLASCVILIFSRLSSSFADFFNLYISSFVRFVISHVTGVLPFSLGETIVISLPLILFLLLFFFFKFAYKDDIKARRYLINMFSAASLMFSLFVVTFGTAYGCTPLDKRLGIEAAPVEKDELEYTAGVLRDKIGEVINDVDFSSDGSSVMPYSFDELNDKLNDAYIRAAKKYDLLPALRSNVKLLAVSPVMTYTHISGIFTYYTCEANINFNYPDYDFPYTMAHEMAHQRGIAPEDEANFTALLVCMESDDPYIQYSAYLSVFEYVLSAYYSADADAYSTFISNTDIRIRSEMTAFSEFFEKYRTSTASKITNAVNDTYLKASGESAGAKSYGMVVDLACAFFHK